MKYISTYRLSQDHLEIFFGRIRQKGGYNNNPNVVQFKSAYKKLLNHLELKSAFRGNCVPLEKLNVLTCTPENYVKEINVSTIGYREDEDSKNVIMGEADLEKEWVEQQNIDIDNNLVTVNTKQIVYVVARLGLELKCELCIKALLATEVSWFHKLIVIKDKGGLCYQTQQVFDICLICETVIRLAIKISGSKSLHPKYGPMYLATRTLEKIQANSTIKGFAIHSMEHLSSLQMDHSLLLINAIICKYIKIRLYHESKMFTLYIKKQSKRQLYNKVMLHSGV